MITTRRSNWTARGQQIKAEGHNLTAARRWLQASGQFSGDLADPERQRRVAAYAAQVARHGHITQWLKTGAANAICPDLDN